MTNRIDLNCDLGEGMGIEEDIMPYISSANIACGQHAGNNITMNHVAKLAAHYKVAIGAHPSWNDRENFGRKNMQLPANETYALIQNQVSALAKICHDIGVPLHHVKPHGALYNQAAHDAELAAIIVKAIKDLDPKLFLYGPAGSEMMKAASAEGLPFVSEVFADRTYTNAGALTPRTEANALIEDVDLSVRQAIQFAANQSVITTGGKTIQVKAESICIHGDGKKAIELAMALVTAFRREGILVQAP